MDCNNSIIGIIPYLIATSSVMIILSLVLIEKSGKMQDEESVWTLGDFLGYFSYLFSSYGLNAKGKIFRAIYIIGFFIMISTIFAIKLYDIGPCFK